MSPLPTSISLWLTQSTPPVKNSCPIYMKSEEDRLLTKKEVCAQLGIGETSVWNLTKRGRLTAVKVGKSVRYRQSEVTDILNSTND